MKRIGVAMALGALAAVPLAGQEIDLGVWVVSPSFQADNVIDAVDAVEIQFDENLGYGVTGDIHWSDLLSTELGVYGFDADGSLVLGFLDEELDLGPLDVMPITATIRAHFGSDRFDVYVGAGAAYVIFDDLESQDLASSGTERIEIDEEVTWLANIGLNFMINEGLGIGVDAKWLSLDADTLSEDGEAVHLELDPLMISAGIFLRF